MRRNIWFLESSTISNDHLCNLNLKLTERPLYSLNTRLATHFQRKTQNGRLRLGSFHLVRINIQSSLSLQKRWAIARGVSSNYRQRQGQGSSWWTPALSVFSKLELLQEKTLGSDWSGGVDRHCIPWRWLPLFTSMDSLYPYLPWRSARFRVCRRSIWPRNPCPVSTTNVRV